MAEESGSKTEKATPKKRKDQRKEGNVLQSRDVVMVVSLAGSFYILRLLFPSIYENVRDFMIQFIGLAGRETDTSLGTVGKYSLLFLNEVVKTILPLLLVCMALGILATGVQTRFLFSSKSVRPKFSRLNPLQGIKRLFSLKNIVELIKGILKVIVLGAVVYLMIKADMVQVVRTMDMDILNSAVYMLDLISKLIIRICIIFVFIAALDYLYQWWDYERQLKMTKQEVKEEYKQTEGNPEIKGRIRRIQNERARSRMMQAVPEADVVIRNPTHYAVALKYDIDHDNAPIVLAKGQDELALRIIETAMEHHVAVVEDRPLARGLYAAAQINREIPQDFYSAVAEVLVYVYKMNKKMG